MGDLLPFVNGELAQVRRDIKKAQLKLDGLAAFSAQAMDYVNLLDLRRQMLTAHNPAVGPLLEQLEIAFALDARQIQSSMYRGF